MNFVGCVQVIGQNMDRKLEAIIIATNMRNLKQKEIKKLAQKSKVELRQKMN